MISPKLRTLLTGLKLYLSSGITLADPAMFCLAEFQPFLIA